MKQLNAFFDCYHFENPISIVITYGLVCFRYKAYIYESTLYYKGENKKRQVRWDERYFIEHYIKDLADDKNLKVIDSKIIEYFGHVVYSFFRIQK